MLPDTSPLKKYLTDICRYPDPLKKYSQNFLQYLSPLKKYTTDSHQRLYS